MHTVFPVVEYTWEKTLASKCYEEALVESIVYYWMANATLLFKTEAYEVNPHTYIKSDQSIDLYK